MPNSHQNRHSSQSQAYFLSLGCGGTKPQRIEGKDGPAAEKCTDGEKCTELTTYNGAVAKKTEEEDNEEVEPKLKIQSKSYQIW